jgi:hypothetical protein
MADMYPVHIGISRRLATSFLDAGLTGKTLFHGLIPEGEAVPLLPNSPSGQVAPHATLVMDEPDEHPNGRSLEGAISALGVLVFEVFVVASDDLTLTRMRDVVNRALIGWTLPDGGEISSGGGLAQFPRIGMTSPARVGRTLTYFGVVGATSLVQQIVDLPAGAIPSELLFPSDNLFPA